MRSLSCSPSQTGVPEHSRWSGKEEEVPMRCRAKEGLVESNHRRFTLPSRTHLLTSTPFVAATPAAKPVFDYHWTSPSRTGQLPNQCLSALSATPNIATTTRTSNTTTSAATRGGEALGSFMASSSTLPTRSQARIGWQFRVSSFPVTCT